MANGLPLGKLSAPTETFGAGDLEGNAGVRSVDHIKLIPFEQLSRNPLSRTEEALAGTQRKLVNTGHNQVLREAVQPEFLHQSGILRVEVPCLVEFLSNGVSHHHGHPFRYWLVELELERVVSARTDGLVVFRERGKLRVRQNELAHCCGA